METDGYRDGTALWAAASARAKAVARSTGADVSTILRRFVSERFLARVFSDPDGAWVLIGGTAVLARVNDARTTKDVDLLHELLDLDTALVRLRAVAALDLGDHFRFVVTGHEPSLAGTGQTRIDGYRVQIDAYCGARRKDRFGVDLVTGSLMTAEPDVATHAVLELRGLSSPPVRLYPVVDHIADKLCATQATYGAAGDRPSSRVRDLVDLVVFARSQDIDGDSLTRAVRAEWVHRGLDGDPAFAPPSNWERLYPPLARRVRRCEGLTEYSAAVEFVGGFLRPVLDGSATGSRWSASLGEWEPQRR